MTFYLLACVIVAAVSASTASEGSKRKPVSFVREVAPILVSKCQGCHGPKTAESSYRLDTFDMMMQPGDFGVAPITPGNLDESEIHRLIVAADPDERMPNNGGRLSETEIQVIANWILEGAKFDGQNARAPLREQIPTDLPHPAAPSHYPTAIPITAMTFSPDGKLLLVGGYHELLIWELSSEQLSARIGNFPQRTHGMAFSPDFSLLAVAGGSPGVSGEVRMVSWTGQSNRDAESRVLAKHDDMFFDVAFRPDGQQLAAAGADGAVRTFDVPQGVERLRLDHHADWVNDVCYSPDGRYIATASRDRTAKVFDAETGVLLTTHSEHDAPVRAVGFGPEGQTVISAGGRALRVWNVEDSKLVGEMTGFENDVYALLAFGAGVVAASADRTARHFNLSDRTLIRSFTQHSSWVLSVAYHQPTQRMCTGCLDGTVTVWDMEKGTLVSQFVGVPTGR